MSCRIDKRQLAFFNSPQQVWRPIHYLGSKLRLTDEICHLLDGLAEGPVCDLFAGSGTVSLALSRGRDVLAADIQEYSRVICTAILKPSPISDQDVANLLSRAENAAKTGLSLASHRSWITSKRPSSGPRLSRNCFAILLTIAR